MFQIFIFFSIVRKVDTIAHSLRKQSNHWKDNQTKFDLGFENMRFFLIRFQFNEDLVSRADDHVQENTQSVNTDSRREVCLLPQCL